MASWTIWACMNSTYFSGIKIFVGSFSTFSLISSFLTVTNGGQNIWVCYICYIAFLSLLAVNGPRYYPYLCVQIPTVIRALCLSLSFISCILNRPIHILLHLRLCKHLRMFWCRTITGCAHSFPICLCRGPFYCLLRSFLGLFCKFSSSRKNLSQVWLRCCLYSLVASVGCHG